MRIILGKWWILGATFGATGAKQRGNNVMTLLEGRGGSLAVGKGVGTYLFCPGESSLALIIPHFNSFIPQIGLVGHISIFGSRKAANMRANLSSRPIIYENNKIHLGGRSAGARAGRDMGRSHPLVCAPKSGDASCSQRAPGGGHS